MRDPVSDDTGRRPLQHTNAFDKPRVNMTDLFAQLQITPAASHDGLRAGTDIQGTGPYRFVRWKSRESIHLGANRNWHGADKEGGPFLDAIDVQKFADEDARALAFESGDLDLILGAPASVAARYKTANQTHIAPKIGVHYLGVVVDNPVLADPRVRQAIFLAMDRKRMVEELQDGLGGSVTAHPGLPTLPPSTPRWKLPSTTRVAPSPCCARRALRSPSR